MLRYFTLPVTPFQQNCSVVYDEDTRQAAVIDPGGDLERLLAEVEQRGLRLEQIWLTHAHIDHAGGTAELARRLELPIIGPHPADQFWISGLPQQGAMFGFPPAETFTPTRWLQDGDTVDLAGQVLNVRHCPGHTPGHVRILVTSQGQRALVLGDAAHSPVQVLEPDWVSRADMDPEVTRQTRKALLDRLEREEILVAAGHFHAPGYGKIVRLNGRRYWKGL